MPKVALQQWVLTFRSLGEGVSASTGSCSARWRASSPTSLEVSLDAAEVAALEAAVPASRVEGTRYAAAHMALLDSEK